MRGGTVFRCMARIVGAAPVTTTGAFCHVHHPASSSMREQESLLASLNHSQKVVCDVKPNPKELGSSMDTQFELEECDCSLAEKEEGSNGAALRQLVFSAPPTEEEVDKATMELHAALHLSMPAGGYLSEEDQSDDMVALTNGEDGMSTVPKASNKRVTSIPLPSSQHLRALAAESSSVNQAIELSDKFESSVLSNEKVQELMLEDPLDVQESSANDDNSTLEITDPNERMFLKLYGFVTTRTRVYYSFVKGKLFSILNSMFGSMEKTIFSKEGTSARDKTTASCMMLAVAVLIIVVLRRRL